MEVVEKIKIPSNQPIFAKAHGVKPVQDCPMNSPRYKKMALPALAILGILMIFTLILSITLGRYPITIPALLKILLGFPSQNAALETVIFSIRLPRVLAAAMIGSTMALAGASYQGMFKNPMVSPDILGASAGAGFGAALAILLSASTFYVQTSAFIFSLGAVFLTLSISKIVSKGSNVTLILILSGMVVGSLFASLLSIMKYVADPESKLPAITFWLMGGLAMIGKNDALLLMILLSIGSLPLLLIRWKFNAMSFGDEEAMAMGIHVKQVRLVVIACSTLLTAACVSVCGLVGWVGVVVPHMTRLLVGPNFKTLLPASALMGAIFLTVVDDVARCAFSIEIPLGILTSLIGAPFFMYLLVKGKRGWA